MRRALLIIIALAAVVLVAAVIGQRWFTRPAAEPGPAALGEFSAREQQEITARGILVPIRWTNLSFPVGGSLDKLAVKTGDVVSAGQEVASLSTQELELEVQLAQSELEIQEAALAALEEGPSTAEISAATATYEAAVAAYEKLKAGPSAAERDMAEADLKSAEKALQRAQAAYDAVRNLPDIGARPESVQLEQATLDYQRAKAAYELATSGPSEAALKQAESQVDSAKAQLEALTSAQPSAIRAAQASVARARVNLAQATLRAPFSGTVTSVIEAQPGEMINPGDTIVTLADLSQLQAEITDLDEWGAVSVKLTQRADLHLPSLGRILRGHLAFVSAEPTLTASGAVFYKAILALDEQGPDLRWGMIVRATFASPQGRSNGSNVAG